MNRFYFAYGSNMNPDRIRARIPEARAVGKATIHGWRLVERLYADIEPARGGRVEGVLYLVTDTELRRLDAYEGFPFTYAMATVNAYLDGTHKVRAVTYLMTERARKERSGKPYPEDYRIICAVGARYWGLSSNPFGTLKPPKKPSLGWFGLW